MSAVNQKGVAPRSVIGAVFLSIVIPGAGAMYGGRSGDGIFQMILFVLGFVIAVAITPYVVLLFPILYLFALLSAASSVKQWNAAHGIVS
jgi:TM2 domain-containing membrane protein YozV